MTEPTPYDATFQHIEIIARKVDKLMQAQLDAERQVLHRIKCDYVAGKLSLEEMCELYLRYRALMYESEPGGKQAHKHRRPSVTTLWNEVMPVQHSVIQRKVRALDFDKRYEQNEDGYWSGVADLQPDAPRPRDGQAVVYVLFDDRNVPCYVGSSEKFKSRIDAHYRNNIGGSRSSPDMGKDFARWVAYPCADREAAYQLEDRLLKEHKPYLNKRAGR